MALHGRFCAQIGRLLNSGKYEGLLEEWECWNSLQQAHRGLTDQARPGSAQPPTASAWQRAQPPTASAWQRGFRVSSGLLNPKFFSFISLNGMWH